MADQIEINIYLKDDAGTPTSDDNVTGTGGDIAGMAKTPGSENKKDKALKNLGKYVASQTIGVFIQDTKGAISQNIGLVTGKRELQERVNFGMEVVQQGVNTFKNAYAGATIASAAGIGGGWGVLIGVALTAIQFGINTAFKYNALGIQENLENKQINHTLSRYGAGYNKSRSGL